MIKTVSLIDRKTCSFTWVKPCRVFAKSFRAALQCVLQTSVWVQDDHLRIGAMIGRSPEDWGHDCLMYSLEFHFAVLRDFQLLANLIRADFKALSKEITSWPTSCQTAIFKKKR